MPESAARIQEMAPTRAAADKLYDERVARTAKGDANDSLWAIESIEDYSPEADFPKIKAKVLLVNTVEAIEAWRSRGFRIFAYGTDISLLQQSLRSGLTRLRAKAAS